MPMFTSSTLNRRGLVLGASAFASALALGRRTVMAQDAPTSSLGWTDELAGVTDRLRVATTVSPISSLVRNVGGTRIALRGIVPAGVNSHTFEPAPTDAMILANADVLIANGLFLEEPTMELAAVNLPDGAGVFTLADKTITEAEWAFDFSFPQDQGRPNPHLWLNPILAMRYAELAKDELSRLDPDNAAYYAENYTLHAALLTALDEGIMAAAATVPEANRKLITYHDSYAYFAPRYGFTVIGAVQPADFAEPSPKEVAGLIDQIRAEQVPAVFGSEVFPSDVLEQIASEAGAVYVDQLRDDDPPGEAGDPENTYVGMMLKNMELMIPALGGNVDALAGIQPWDTYLP
jgi:ABC-type Zn uptake system ZnuABC Zn-binding protein ZnuA